MPRYSKPSKERWVHPNYRKAYCFRYANGMVYTSIDSFRKATGYEWKPSNKPICMEILNERLYAASKKIIIIESKRLTDLIVQFNKDYVSKQHQDTQAAYKRIYKQFIIENYELQQLNEIREMLMKVKNSLKLSDNTMWKRMQRLRKMFDFAVDMEWMDRNPVKNSMVGTYIHKEVEICTKKHIELLINYFNVKKQEDMALMLEFAFITGLRIQEIMNLKWENISDNRIDLIGKGSKKRSIPVKAFPQLNKLLERLRILSIEKPFKWRNQQTPQRFLREALPKLKKKYPDMEWTLTFHVIRKTVINIWRNAGIAAEARNIIAGHSRDVEKGFYLSEPELEYLEKSFEKLSKI